MTQSRTSITALLDDLGPRVERSRERHQWLERCVTHSEQRGDPAASLARDTLAIMQLGLTELEGLQRRLRSLRDMIG